MEVQLLIEKLETLASSLDCVSIDYAAKTIREAASALRSSGEAAAWLCENKGDTGATTLPSAVEYWRARGWKVTPLYLHPATPASAWRPIAEAPRDGRELILLLGPSRIPQVAYSNTWWTAGFSVECKPTHWMPIADLPTPPTSTKGG